jgi:hypothetical protein
VVDSNPWLTIATVVKDDSEGFARTWASLESSDLAGVEVVVVDSSAPAESAALAEMVEVGLGHASVVYEWREPAGIYPAMNEALALATGEYMLYLNAGDELFDAGTLERLRGALVAGRPEWAFGPVEIIEADGHRVITPSWDYSAEKRALFSRGHFPAHQGTVVHRDLLTRAGGFDTSYRISADYACFLQLAQAADPFVLPFVLARFHEGGVSTMEWQESFREFHRARREILRPQGAAALRERWETMRHHALVYAHRELRPRLGWSR